MFCNECGTAVTADSKFCKACGSVIQKDHPVTLAFDPQDTDTVDDPVQKDRLLKLLEMAFWHNDVGNIEPAIRACEAALQINPASATAHSLLSTLFEKKGDDERAIEHLEAVVNLNPTSAADIAKLDNLRRGIHVRAAEPSRMYRWVPPAFAGLVTPRVKSLSRSKKPADGALSVLPIVYASVAVFAVIVGGYLMLRQGARPLQTHETTIALNPAAATTAPDTLPVASPPPIITGPAPDFSKSKERDPFADTDDQAHGAVSTPYASLPTPVRRPAVDPALRPLPPAPLSLNAVPVGTQPAPVQIANDLPSLPAGPINQHTVMVPSLPSNGQSSAGVSGQDPAAASTPPPVIRITVHDTPQTSAPTGGIRVTPQASSGSGDRASNLESSALAMQQDGDYSGAAATYQQAIRAFKSQIASGQNGDAAAQGLKACQTGLEICQQSQQ